MPTAGNDEVRGRNDGLEQPAFRGDGLAQTGVRRHQGVLAAGFRVALQQHLIGGVQVQYIAGNAAAPQLADQRRNGFDFIGPVAGVQPNGGTRIGVAHSAYRVGDEWLEQCRRNVVDAVKVQVLQHMEGNAFTGARQAADNDQPHLLSTMKHAP